MHFATAPLAAALLAGAANAQYVSSITYDASNFFTTWDFFSGADPTNGFVEYVDATTANDQGLAGQQDGAIFMGVDSVTVGPANGRKSVRLTSQQAFTKGLFIADIAHMPASVCGSWPAFWMFGPNWPGSGEIDIIEGVNTQETNSVTLHTSAGCTIDNSGTVDTTTLVGNDCGAGNSGTGCGQSTADNQNYGDGFNAIGGGVYATEWTSDYVAVWFFPRSSIPGDVSSGSPDPQSWGQPIAKFNGPIDQYFQNNNLVFDTTFCGDWAGKVWSDNAECAALSTSCEDYVSQNPLAFAEAYWTVNSIQVYQDPTATSKRHVGLPYTA